MKTDEFVGDVVETSTELGECRGGHRGRVTSDDQDDNNQGNSGNGQDDRHI
jgi:hypothetical protein